MKKNNKKAMYDMVKKMNRGGGPIIGRIKPKDMEKVTPIGVKKITTGEMMQAASDKARSIKDPSLRKTVAEVERPKRKKRRRKNKKAEYGMKMKSYKAGGAVKPDFIDIDGDGNKEESMKEAAKGNNQAYKGMKIKKAKGGMKVYNNGGKEDPKKLATPEEIKASRSGSQRGRTEEQKKARKESKRKAKDRARRGAPGTGTGLVKTATTEATGPETLRTGQVKRRGRRLERAAERAGLTKADAYDRSEKAALDSFKKADAAKKEAQAAGDKKGERKANKQINRLARVEKAQQKYEGMDKKRAIIPVKGKKPAKPGGDEEKKKKKKGPIKLRLNRGAKPSSPSTRTNPRRARRPIITRETSGFREHYNRPK